MCDYMIKNLIAQYKVNKLKENDEIKHVGVYMCNVVQKNNMIGSRNKKDALT